MKMKKKKEYTKIYPKILRATKILWENNVRLIGGTDLPNSALNPGISLWEELDVLMEAGLGFWDAVKTVTGYASTVLDTDLGRIDNGLEANLLLLRREPRNVNDLEIDAIVLRDKIIKPEELREKLKKISMFGM